MILLHGNHQRGKGQKLKEPHPAMRLSRVTEKDALPGPACIYYYYKTYKADTKCYKLLGRRWLIELIKIPVS